MIHFHDRRFLFSRTIVEFARESDIVTFSTEKSDIVLSFNMFLTGNETGYEPVLTWLLNYDGIKTPDDLLHQQSKNVRNAYSYCLKEGYQHVFLDSSAIRKSDLRNFKKMCDQMYKNRGLKTRVNTRFLMEYVHHHNLVLSYVRKENQVFSYHVYTVDGAHARNWYACSPVHTSENNNLLGKISRFNRYSDMVRFYLMGYESYDFGGLNSLASPDGRAKYKMGFSGEPVYLFQKSFFVSWKANLYWRVAALFHRLRS